MSVSDDERFEQLIAFLGSQLPPPVDSHTASDGSFNFGVRADSNFDLYAKVVLNDGNGTSLGNWYSFSDWDTDTNTVGSHSGTSRCRYQPLIFP